MEKERFEKYLQDCRFNDLDTDITRPDFRFNINGVDCVPRGEIVAVAGKPGVGKSTALAMFVGVLLGRSDFAGIRGISLCKNVLWIDTEKGAFSIMQKMKILRNIANINDGMTPEDHGIDIFAIRSISTEDRLDFVKDVAGRKDYDVIVIDGIFDLTKDPDKNYIPVIDLLKKLADSGASVFAMLHTNKQSDDDNMRYALGTELQRVYTTRFTVRYNDKKGCNLITHDKSNDSTLAPAVCFQFRADGMVEPFMQESKTNAKVDSSIKDFETILKGGVILSHTELTEKVMAVANIKERGAIERIAKGVERGYLGKDSDGNYYLKNWQ